jgi:hypothetical protein
MSSILTAWLWADPGPDVAAAHNAGLRRRLGLPPLP